MVLNVVRAWYFKKLTDRLARLGLTYHDAIADTGVVEKAVSRLPPQMQMERARRLTRALDLSSKHEEIPVEKRENPWREFKQVEEVMSETQKEHDERRALGGQWWMPWHIGRESWFGYETKGLWFWEGKK